MLKPSLKGASAGCLMPDARTRRRRYIRSAVDSCLSDRQSRVADETDGIRRADLTLMASHRTTLRSAPLRSTDRSSAELVVKQNTESSLGARTVGLCESQVLSTFIVKYVRL